MTAPNKTSVLTSKNAPKDVDAPPTSAALTHAARMREFVQVGHNAEFPNEGDLVQRWYVVAAAAAAAIDATEVQGGLIDAVCLGERAIEQSELLLALV